MSLQILFPVPLGFLNSVSLLRTLGLILSGLADLNGFKFDKSLTFTFSYDSLPSPPSTQIFYVNGRNKTFQTLFSLHLLFPQSLHLSASSDSLQCYVDTESWADIVFKEKKINRNPIFSRAILCTFTVFLQPHAGQQILLQADIWDICKLYVGYLIEMFL